MRIVAVDCTHAKLRGQDKVIVQAVDAQTGITLDIDILPGEDKQTIAGYVCQLAELTGCAVLTSDDADAFKLAADAAGLAHQICQRHVVPNSLQLLDEIACQLEALPSDQTGPCGVSVEQALDDIATLEETILARAPGSGRLLEQLRHRYQGAGPPPKGRKATPWYRLRLLTLDVAEDWPRLSLTEHYRDTDGQRLVPATNNVSERAISLNIKERYRTMRGYKSEVSLRCLPMLTAYLAEHQGTQCFSSLLAA